MPQGSIYWQGTQRRSCAPGAHWNVQVVRGKVTTRCLWHACKALGIGLLLMLLGACMATIGYYADQLSTGQEIRGNVTVKVKNKSKGFHLNNLSYAGPIVMGVGGFIVVAACVMTFEARDSAAKVVPARFRFSQGSTLKYARNQRPRRSTSSQTSKWDHQLGLFRINKTPSPNAYEISRKQLTAEFLRFSKNLNEKNNPQINTIKKSPSAPSLVTKKSPLKKKQTTKYSGCSLLNPELLKRHALSVDNPGYSPTKSKDNNDNNNKINGSQMSMAMDLYLPNKGPVTLKIKDRSDTARRHQLLRQTKIEDMEEEEAKRQASIRRHAESVAYMMGAYARYPTDFVSRKRASIDLRLTDEYGAIGVLSKGNSPRDLRKTSPNFRQMSVDRSSSLRKSSIDFRKSPDFRRSDNKYMMDEVEIRSRSNTGESNRKARHKLHHSKSDESRRKSLDRHNRRDSHQESRHSLNTPVVIETCGPEYELKYFTPNSIDKDNASNTTEDSHVIEIEETEIHITTASIEDYPNDNALVEEPELETINDNEIDEKLSHKIIDDEKNKNKYIDEYNSNEPTINVDD